ncbi:hypothetical protein BKA69DRAFT_1045903, partial [Paraphysoderma sedebokerense]
MIQCKCFCPPPLNNYTIISDLTDCSTCNKKLCESKTNLTCVNDIGGGSVCFERESIKDQVIILTFLIFLGALLLIAVLKPYWRRWRERTRNRYFR